MQKFSVADGGTATGQAKDRVGLTAGTTYFAKYWNDNFFNIFNAVENAGYSLIDDDLEQFTKALKGKYDAAYTYNTSGFASQTVSDIVEGSDGLLYEVQSDGTTGDDPVGSVTGDWKAYIPPFIARLEKQVTHDMGSDANYTLTSDQNTFGRLIITDTNPFLSTARDIIVGDEERYILCQNNTLQTLTFKTAAGTGIAVVADSKVWLLCDGTNVIEAIDSAESETRLNTAAEAYAGQPAGEEIYKQDGSVIPSQLTSQVVFTGITTASILSSQNIASVVRTGAGTYAVTFAVAMNNTNYNVTPGGNRASGTPSGWAQSHTKTTAGFILITTDAGGTFTDWAEVNLKVSEGRV